MFVKQFRIGVQSWCFRTYKTTDEVIAAVQASGLDALELCGVHLDINDAAAVVTALARYRESGIAITSFGVAGMPNDEAACRPLFEFAQKAGFTAISADPDPTAFALVEGLCAEYGVNIAIHNHGRRHRWGAVRELEAVFARTSPHIGLCLDTAWMLDSGENPVKIARHFADRLYGVHIKDFTFQADGSAEDVIVGTGNLQLPALFTALQEINFRGYTTLEYEGDESNPIPSVQACVGVLQRIG